MWGWEAIPDGWKGLGALPKVAERGGRPSWKARRGREALPKIWEGWEGWEGVGVTPGGLGGVVRHFWRDKRGQEPHGGL